MRHSKRLREGLCCEELPNYAGMSTSSSWQEHRSASVLCSPRYSMLLPSACHDLAA